MFEDVLFAIEATYFAKKVVSITDSLYNYDVREDGAVGLRTKNTSKLFKDKWDLVVQRARLRKSFKEFDLLDYYLGSQVLSCLQIALNTSDEWKNYQMFNKYVTHPDIQESIKKVSLKGAPLKFAAPERLLKAHCQFILFVGCWLLHKTGFANQFSM